MSVEQLLSLGTSKVLHRQALLTLHTGQTPSQLANIAADKPDAYVLPLWNQQISKTLDKSDKSVKCVIGVKQSHTQTLLLLQLFNLGVFKRPLCYCFQAKFPGIYSYTMPMYVDVYKPDPLIVM